MRIERLCWQIIRIEVDRLTWLQSQFLVTLTPDLWLIVCRINEAKDLLEKVVR